MREILCGLALTVLTSGIALAQDHAESRGQGYGFFAPGVISPGGTGTMQVGAGGEFLVYQGLGIGAEIGYATPWESLGDGIGIASLDASYHFRKAHKKGKVVPFVTGGYSLAFRSGTANLVNFGAGLNYWFRERLGLRFEVRDHVTTESPTGHILGFRIAVAFR